MKYRVIVQQQDLDDYRLVEIMLRLSESVYEQEEKVIFIPRPLCLQSITLTLQMWQVSFCVEKQQCQPG